jgi:hypothetical protein
VTARQRTALVFFLLAGLVSAISVSSPRPAAAAPPSTQTVNRSATFSTSGQSLWGPGAAQPPTDITNPIFDAPWSASGTAGGVDSVDFDPCFGILGGCNQHIGSFGASLTGSTSGVLGMSYTVHGQTGGTLGVHYPVHVTFTAPADDTFAPGATVAIDSSLSVDPSANVSTVYPTFDSLSLDGKFRFHLGVSGQICFFTCTSGSLFTIDLPTDGSTAQGALLSLTKSQLESLPGFGLTNCFNFATNILLGLGSYPNARCNNNGYVAFPDVTVGTTVNGDGSLTADGTDTYVIVPVSAVSWVARLLGLPPGFPNLSASLGDFTLSYTTLNLILTGLLSERQTLHFTPTVHVSLHLPRAMSWSVVGGGSGNSDTINYTAGQTVHLTIPTDQAGPLQISPTLSFANGNNVSNHTADSLSGNFEIKALSFALKIPPVSVDFGDLGSFQVWDGINISAGPVYDQNFPLGSTGLYSRDNSWQLGGFNSPGLDPFSLTPDPPPVATAQTVTPVEGASFTGKVGHFVDPDQTDATNQASADYAATINWGDGTPATAGTITGPDSGFDVTGTHTYAEEGTYSVTVTVNDDDTVGVTSTAHSTATVSDAALTTTASNPLSAVEGKPFGPLTFGSFTDADPAGTVSDYTATINWGDSSSSPAVVTANGNHFDVSFPGTHTYAEEGHPNLVVHVADAGGATTNIVVATSVADAPLHASGVTDNTTSSGNHVLMWPVPPGTGIVATFTDEDPGGVVPDYTATINWGDGNTSAGTIGTGSGGAFTVKGTHAYTALGEHTVTITIHDEGGSVATATTTTLSFGYAAGGTFAIGDGNASLGTDVTFWGAQWSKVNTLSGGSAPAAFKGFADSPNTITRCSTAWSTDPGSSSGPPATVPSYMAVAVASTVTKSGSTISGNSPKLVVVHTRSGYGPAAGHTGTGTVVATICG